MKKLFSLALVLFAGYSSSQTHDFVMQDHIMSYVANAGIHYDSLYNKNYGVDQEYNIAHENKYVVSIDDNKVSFYNDGFFMAESNLLSFNETKDRIHFSFMDHGSISDSDYMTYAVYNKSPKESEPRFLLYYVSQLDKITTVCYRTVD